MKNKKRFLGLFLLYAKLCGDIGDASLNDLTDNFQVIIDPLNKAILSSQLSVPVKKIHKKLGDSFNKGDVLLELDNAIYMAQYKKAKAVLEKAQNTYQAKEELFDARIASLSELKEAYALWATAQAELEVSKKQLEACKIVAPYRGKVANVLLFEHELPQVGQPLVEVVGDEVLLAKMLVDAKYLPLLSIGKPIEVYVNELKQNLTAHIKRIGSVIDPASSTIAVEAEIENTDSSLISGMTGFTQFSNEVAATQVTLEGPKKASSSLEASPKVDFIAKTVLQNEGLFNEAIKSGVLPLKSSNIPLKHTGKVNPTLAERHEESGLRGYYYVNQEAPKVYIAFQSQLDPFLSPYYSYTEPKKIYEWIYFNGRINEPLAEASLNPSKEKTRFYVYEGALNDKVPMRKAAEEKPLAHASHLNDQLVSTSIENASNEENFYRIVKEAEELSQFEEKLKDNLAPLSYIPAIKPSLQIEPSPIVEKPKHLPEFKEKSSHLNEHIAIVDRAVKKLPKSVYHQNPLAYQGSFNDLIAQASKQETLEELTEPLAFIPELKASIEEQIEPLTFIPELKVEKQTPFVITNSALAAIERAVKYSKEYPQPDLIYQKEESIALQEKAEEPSLEWRETLMGGGNGGKEIE